MSFEDWAGYHDFIVGKGQAQSGGNGQNRPLRSPSQLSSHSAQQQPINRSQPTNVVPVGRTYREQDGRSKTAQRNAIPQTPPKKKLNKRKKIRLTKAGKEFFTKLALGVGAVGAVGLSATILFSALNGHGGTSNSVGAEGVDKYEDAFAQNIVESTKPTYDNEIFEVPDTSGESESIKDDTVVDQPVVDEAPVVEDEWTLEEALAYKDYCYYGNYGKEIWLKCPQDKVLENAELAIKLMEEDFAQRGTLKTGEDGRYIADWITPEFISAIAMNESSYRVEDANGVTIGGLRGRPAEKNAEGMTQCLKETARDIYEFYARHSDDVEFENLLNIDGEKDPRHNPFLAECYTVGLFQWMETYYLYEGSDLCNALGIDRSKMSEEEWIETMQSVAAGCYYTGVAGVDKDVKKGKLNLADFQSPDKNSSFDAIMYAGRMVMHRDQIINDIANAQEMGD